MDTAELRVRGKIREYTATHRVLLDADPEFRQWLQEKYKPIAGGWQY